VTYLTIARSVLAELDEGTDKMGKRNGKAAVEWEFVLVTPVLALEWLSLLNWCNRKLCKSTVLKYATAMASGLWDEEESQADQIQFATAPDGRVALINGQHRCAAVVKSGVSIWFWVVRGLPFNAWKRCNGIGEKKGTLAQLLTKRGVMYASFKLAALRYVKLLSTGVGGPVQDEHEFDALTSVHQREMHWLMSIRRVKGFTAGYFLGPCTWLSRGYSEEVDLFYEAVSTGGMQRPGSAALRLRDIMLVEPVSGEVATTTSCLKTLSAFDKFQRDELKGGLHASPVAYQRFCTELGYGDDVTGWATRFAKRERARRAAMRGDRKNRQQTMDSM